MGGEGKHTRSLKQRLQPSIWQTQFERQYGALLWSCCSSSFPSSFPDTTHPHARTHPLPLFFLHRLHRAILTRLLRASLCSLCFLWVRWTHSLSRRNLHPPPPSPPSYPQRHDASMSVTQLPSNCCAVTVIAVVFSPLPTVPQVVSSIATFSFSLPFEEGVRKRCLHAQCLLPRPLAAFPGV